MSDLEQGKRGVPRAAARAASAGWYVLTRADRFSAGGRQMWDLTTPFGGTCCEGLDK